MEEQSQNSENINTNEVNTNSNKTLTTTNENKENDTKPEENKSSEISNNINSSNSLNTNASNDNKSKEEQLIFSKNKKFKPEDFVTLLSIGYGNFSEVFMVEHIDTKILYSLKMFNKKRVESLKKQEDVLMEKHVMEKIEEHENIIKYYGSDKDEVN